MHLKEERLLDMSEELREAATLQSWSMIIAPEGMPMRFTSK